MTALQCPCPLQGSLQVIKGVVRGPELESQQDVDGSSTYICTRATRKEKLSGNGCLRRLESADLLIHIIGPEPNQSRYQSAVCGLSKHINRFRFLLS